MSKKSETAIMAVILIAIAGVALTLYLQTPNIFTGAAPSKTSDLSKPGEHANVATPGLGAGAQVFTYDFPATKKGVDVSTDIGWWEETSDYIYVSDVFGEGGNSYQAKIPGPCITQWSVAPLSKPGDYMRVDFSAGTKYNWEITFTSGISSSGPYLCDIAYTNQNVELHYGAGGVHTLMTAATIAKMGEAFPTFDLYCYILSDSGIKIHESNLGIDMTVDKLGSGASLRGILFTADGQHADCGAFAVYKMSYVSYIGQQHGPNPNPNPPPVHPILDPLVMEPSVWKCGQSGAAMPVRSISIAFDSVSSRMVADMAASASGYMQYKFILPAIWSIGETMEIMFVSETTNNWDFTIGDVSSVALQWHATTTSGLDILTKTGSIHESDAGIPTTVGMPFVMKLKWNGDTFSLYNPTGYPSTWTTLTAIGSTYGGQVAPTVFTFTTIGSSTSKLLDIAYITIK